MADISVGALKSSLSMLDCKYEPDKATEIRDLEKKADHYEDILGSYLVKLATHELSSGDSKESSKLLHVIGDFERISDHCSNIASCVIQMSQDKLDVHNYHNYLSELKTESREYADIYKSYTEKYLKPIN
jgi:phosphate:Na+ symporter